MENKLIRMALLSTATVVGYALGAMTLIVWSGIQLNEKMHGRLDDDIEVWVI